MLHYVTVISSGDGGDQNFMGRFTTILLFSNKDEMLYLCRRALGCRREMVHLNPTNSVDPKRWNIVCYFAIA